MEKSQVESSRPVEGVKAGVEASNAQKAPEKRIAQQIEGLVEAPKETVCKWCKGGECTGACRD